MCDLTITRVSYNYKATREGKKVKTVPYSAKNVDLENVVSSLAIKLT